jgi:hypothetical protein
MFAVCIGRYIQKREEKFSWMEMGIVVKICVPIQPNSKKKISSRIKRFFLQVLDQKTKKHGSK